MDIGRSHTLMLLVPSTLLLETAVPRNHFLFQFIPRPHPIRSTTRVCSPPHPCFRTIGASTQRATSTRRRPVVPSLRTLLAASQAERSQKKIVDDPRYSVERLLPRRSGPRPIEVLCAPCLLPHPISIVKFTNVMRGARGACASLPPEASRARCISVPLSLPFLPSASTLTTAWRYPYSHPDTPSPIQRAHLANTAHGPES
ncbi:hypothetical protein B0H19DRAFT_1272507 [Mycena capillaripes]|nr:hypothetical protein B0H19DRAFT_1272507 [Mycena capillaripes]